MDKGIKHVKKWNWIKGDQYVKKVEEEFWKVDFDASRVIIFLTETDVEDSASNDNSDDNDSEAEK